MAIKSKKNRKYYRKCSNNFAADCSCFDSFCERSVKAFSFETVILVAFECDHGNFFFLGGGLCLLLLLVPFSVNYLFWTSLVDCT